ncbi:hypothetical protein IG631_22112 [Alternaria alternata]|nr:hypothetical protein IG631_22112 [Alternaria alternata]
MQGSQICAIMLRESRKNGGGAVSIEHSPLDDKAGRLVGRRRTVHGDTVCSLDDRTQTSAADTPHCIVLIAVNETCDIPSLAPPDQLALCNSLCHMTSLGRLSLQRACPGHLIYLSI